MFAGKSRIVPPSAVGLLTVLLISGVTMSAVAVVTVKPVFPAVTSVNPRIVVVSVPTIVKLQLENIPSTFTVMPYNLTLSVNDCETALQGSFVALKPFDAADGSWKTAVMSLDTSIAPHNDVAVCLQAGSTSVHSGRWVSVSSLPQIKMASLQAVSQSSSGTGAWDSYGSASGVIVHLKVAGYGLAAAGRPPITPQPFVNTTSDATIGLLQFQVPPDQTGHQEYKLCFRATPSANYSIIPTSAMSNIHRSSLIYSTTRGIIFGAGLSLGSASLGSLTSVTVAIRYSLTLLPGDRLLLALPGFTRKTQSGGILLSQSPTIVFAQWDAGTSVLNLTVHGDNPMSRPNQTITVEIPSSFGLVYPQAHPKTNNHLFGIEIAAAAGSTASRYSFMEQPFATHRPAKSAFGTSDATWAQLVAATKIEYTKQDTYASSRVREIKAAETTEESLNVKPPPRFGHTTISTRFRYYDWTIKSDIYVFGGIYGEIRKDLWMFKPGIFPNGSDVINTPRAKQLRAATETSIANEATVCSATKLSAAYPHVCNTWKRMNTTITKKECGSVLSDQRILMIAGLCIGSTHHWGAESEAMETQECVSNAWQRLSMNLAQSSTTIRVGATFDEYGQRVGGKCLTDIGGTAKARNVSFRECISGGSSSQTIKVVKQENENTYTLQFVSSNLCLAVPTVTLSGRIGLPVVTLGTSLVQRDCSPVKSYERRDHFVSFSVEQANNECATTQEAYSTSGESYSANRQYGTHLGRYNHAATVLYPSGNFDDASKSIIVISGGQDKTTGFLSDLWTFEIGKSSWTKVYNGNAWMIDMDAHLHGNYDIEMRVATESAESSLSPNPRAYHTVSSFYDSQSSSVLKAIEVHENTTITDAQTYGTAKFQVGQENAVIFPDNDSSGAPIARTRDFGMFLRAKESHKWDGVTYPFSFTFTSQGSQINQYVVTLIGVGQVRLQAPVFRTTSYTITNSDDKFVTTNISSVSTYNVALLYTCSAMTQAVLNEILSGKARGTLAGTACGASQTFVAGPESYLVIESRVTRVEVRSDTVGHSSLVMFGGWAVSNSNSPSSRSEAPSSELWVFRYKAQLGSLVNSGSYNAKIHDSPFSVFPCCGSIQTCCGSARNPHYSYCKSRREALEAAGKCLTNQCCGEIPVLSRWQKITPRSYGDGTPSARYGHTADIIGVPTALVDQASPNAYRILIFGGQDSATTFNELWELSLESSPSDTVVADTVLRCAATDGYFNISIGYVQVTLAATAVLQDVREALKIAKSDLHLVNIQSPLDARLCGNSFETPKETRFGVEAPASFLGKTVFSTAHDSLALNARAGFVTFRFLTATFAYQAINYASSSSSPATSAFVWARGDNAVSVSNRPPARAFHSSTVHKDKASETERLIVYGGWDGNTVLRDVWVYSPSHQWGGSGQWEQLVASSGEYLSCTPSLFVSTIDLTGFSCSNVTDSMPARSRHSMQSITTAFPSEEGKQQPLESLVVYGGASHREVPAGENWNRYGFAFGGVHSDLFSLCLEKDDAYCSGARSLAD